MTTMATRLPRKFAQTTAALKAAKYKNTKIEIDGVTFDSKREANRYGELKLQEKAGLIRDLKLQPKFLFEFEGRKVLIRSEHYKNGRQASLKLDFQYFDLVRDKTVYEDVKSPATRTQAYTLRKAMLECMRPGIVVEEV